MNYKERISALESFKASISGGAIEDSAASFTTEISGWVGGETAKNGYDGYVNKVKADTAKITGKRDSFTSKIDERISSIQAKFNEEYNLNSWYFKMKHESDPIKDKQKKRQQLNILSIDDSVKAKIRQNFL